MKKSNMENDFVTSDNGYWPQCDVEGCEGVSCCGGTQWRETGYWSLCPKHSQMAREGKPQPKMKQSAIDRENSRDENGQLPNSDKNPDECDATESQSRQELLANNLLKDWKEELEKEVVRYCHAELSPNVDTTSYRDGAEWSKSFFLPIIQRLQEEREATELKLEEKTKAASTWASKCMELGSQRVELQSEIKRLQEKSK